MYEGMLVMKRLFAVLLAMVMVMMAGSVFAADLTITNATKGQTYKAFKVFDAMPTDPEELSAGVSYSATLAQTQVEGFLDVFTIHPNAAGQYTIEKKDGVMDNDVIAFIKDHIDALKQGEALSGEFTSDSQYVFSDLDDGYYYVTSTLGSMVSIDTAGKAISIVDKNASAPEGPKKIITDEDSTINEELDQSGLAEEENDASVGSIESFQVDFQAVNWVQAEENDSHAGTGDPTAKTQVTEYNFIDTTVGLDIIPNTVVVTVNGSDITNRITDIAVDNGVLTFTIPWVDEDNNSLYEAETSGSALIPVIVTYNATVTDVAAKRVAVNEVEVKYNGTETLGKDSTKTYTYKFKLLKIDQNDAPLKGAIFEMYYGDTIGDNDQPLTFTKLNETTYCFDPDGNITQITPDGENAEALIIGLDNTNYMLRETVAPTGYSKTDDVSVIGLTKETNSTDDESTVKAGEETIKNLKGSELPSTGGIGTTVFYVIGGLLVIGAAVVLVARRKAQE